MGARSFVLHSVISGALLAERHAQKLVLATFAGGNPATPQKDNIFFQTC